MRGLRGIAAAAALMALPALAAPAGPLDAPETHAFTIVDQQVADVLTEFAGAVGVAIDLGEGVEGRLTNFSGRYTAQGFLDAVTARSGLVWFFDGTAIHVTGADEMKSVVIDFDRVPPDHLTAALEDLDVADPRFPLRRTAAGIGVVTGPPRYVELVENTLLMLAERDDTAPVPRPTRAARSVTVVRGRDVSVWSGLVERDEPEVEPASESPSEATK